LAGQRRSQLDPLQPLRLTGTGYSTAINSRRSRSGPRCRVRTHHTKLSTDTFVQSTGRITSGKLFFVFRVGGLRPEQHHHPV